MRRLLGATMRKILIVVLVLCTAWSLLYMYSVSDKEKVCIHKSVHPPIAYVAPKANLQTNLKLDKWKGMEQELLHAPIDLWSPANIAKDTWGKSKCGKFPRLEDLKTSNLYWQYLKTSQGLVYCFAAYLDNRTALEHSVVRVTVYTEMSPPPEVKCQLWFKGVPDSVETSADFIYATWTSHNTDRKWPREGAKPYLLNCPLPAQFRKEVPAAVSIIQKPCSTSSVALKVFYGKPKSGIKDDFIVCVKGLNYFDTDMSPRLAEWLELTFMLGAGKIVIYNFAIHPNIRSLLQWYEGQGRVEIIPFTLPPPFSNLPYHRTHLIAANNDINFESEVIPYHDCFYKYMYQYKFVVPIDTDEVIIPTLQGNWSSLLENLSSNGLPSQYLFQVFYFLKGSEDESNSPNSKGREDAKKSPATHRSELSHGSLLQSDPSQDYQYMWHHTLRNEKSKPYAQSKTFQSTEDVVIVHNHKALRCLRSCTTHLVDPADGKLHHYRSECPYSLFGKHSPMCRMDINDTRIWNYTELPHRTRNALRRANLHF